MIQTENDDVAQRPGSSVEGDAAVEQPAAVVNHHLPDSAVAGGGNNERLRRRKKLPPHRHMPPQRKAEEDTERNAVPKRLLGKSLGDIDRFRRNVSALVVLLLIGVIGVVYVRPTIFFARHQKQQRLPRRTITTVFPRHLHIGQALPPVVMGYGTFFRALRLVRDFSFRYAHTPILSLHAQQTHPTGCCFILR